MALSLGDYVEVYGCDCGIRDCSNGMSGEVDNIDEHNVSVRNVGIWHEQYLRLVKPKNNNNTMNLKENFVMAFLPEPEKSLRKAGITNGDGILTDDGVKVFLTWLLKKQAQPFVDEVVADILKDNKDTNC